MRTAPKSTWDTAQVRIVLFCFVGLAVNSVPIFAASFPLLMLGLAEDFGDSRTGLSSGVSLHSLGIALSLPFFGRAVDRIGQRTVFAYGIPAFAVVMAMFALLPSSLPAFLALCLFLGVIAGATHQPLFYSILPTYFDRGLGIALGIASTGFSIGITLVPPFAAWLLDQYGWRATFVLLGALSLVAGYLNLFVLRPTQRDKAGPRSSKPVSDDAPGMDFSQARRTVSFWKLVTSYFLLSAMITGCAVHFAPMLTDRGVDRSTVIVSAVYIGVASLATRLICGGLLSWNRIDPAKLASSVFFLGVTGAFLLVSADRPIEVAIAAILIGLALGAEGELLNYMAQFAFGKRFLAQISGALFTAFLFGSMTGPLLMGLSRDFLESYHLAHYGLVIGGLAACVLHFAIAPMRPPKISGRVELPEGGHPALL